MTGLGKKIPINLIVIGVVLTLASLLLFIGGPQTETSRSFKHLWNLGHIAYFFLFCYVVSRIDLVRKRPYFIQCLILLVASIVFGVLIEMGQYDTARSPDSGDVLRDIVGSLLFIAFHPRYQIWLTNLRGRILKSIALILLVMQLIPLIISVIDELLAWKQFPLLSSFETPYELYRWSGSAARSVVRKEEIDPSNIMQVNLSTNRYSGVKLQYFPSDFSAYQHLKLRLYQSQPSPLKVTVRIHDSAHSKGANRYAHHDRFNHSFLLKSGWNELEIDLNQVRQAPRNRVMDMQNIVDVSVFVSRLKQPQTIYLDDVMLIE